MIAQPQFLFRGEGVLTAGEHRFDTPLEVIVGPRAEVDVRISVPLTAENAGDLLRITHSAELEMPMFSLAGTTDEGVTVSSDALYLTRVATPGGVAVEAKLSALQFDACWPRQDGADSDVELGVEYLIPGIKGFGVDQIGTEYGELSLRASAELEDYSAISGSLWLSSGPTIADEIRDAFIDRVLEILSFAQGTRLDWVARKEYRQGRLSAIRLEPTAWIPQPGFAVFSHLNLGPVLELATKRYSEEVREQHGIGVAIAWLLTRPLYREAEFMMGMTALEHLVSKCGAVKHLSVVSKTLFGNSIRPALEEALEALTIPNKQAKESLLRGIARLNQPTSRERLEALISEAQVPMAGLEGGVATLVRTRNVIVHTGQAPVAEPGGSA